MIIRLALLPAVVVMGNNVALLKADGAYQVAAINQTDGNIDYRKTGLTLSDAETEFTQWGGTRETVA